MSGRQAVGRGSTKESLPLRQCIRLSYTVLMTAVDDGCRSPVGPKLGQGIQIPFDGTPAVQIPQPILRNGLPT